MARIQSRERFRHLVGGSRPPPGRQIPEARPGLKRGRLRAAFSVPKDDRQINGPGDLIAATC